MSETAPDLSITAHALARTQAELRRLDLPATLLFDAYNIRYTTGTSVMQVWTLHALDRFALVPADGEPVLWEYPSVQSRQQERVGLVVRHARSWSVFDSGYRSRERAAEFAAEVVAALAELGVTDRRLGLDRLDTYGFLALQEAGLDLVPVQLAMERARSVKCAAEIELVRRSVAVADAAVAHLRSELVPGMTENEAWATFTGHAFAHGGEHAECRLLSSGPRTNPWFQEATDRRIEPGDLVSFDTDLVGPAGYLADLSRAYLAGDVAPSAEQRRLYADAETFLDEILAVLRPGAAYDELGEQLSRCFLQRYHALRYPFIAHGTGLCDEFPTVVFEGHHPGEVEPGMVFSIEAYVGEEGARQGLKLEEQVLVTESGPELLSHAPHDDRLSSR